MAGPSLSGPLTGWTANTITPVAATIAPPKVRRDAEIAARRADERKARLATAQALEKEAQASNDPTKLREAWQAYERVAMDANAEAGSTTPGAARSANLTQEAQHKLAVDFKQRNPTFEFGTGTGPKALLEKLIFEAPTGQVRSYVSQNLFEQTGLGTGTLQDTDVVTPDQRIPRSAALAGSAAGGSGGGGGGGGGGGVGGGGSSAYDLTDEELGVGGPDPRASNKPTTPLEQLLRTIYPDAPVTGASPFADPRAPGSSSGFNDVLAYLTNQSASAGSGYVPSPMLNAPAGAPSAGANIAATIPGAPAFLPGAINELNSFGGFRPMAPVAPAGGGAGALQGLAAISAEQRIQQAQLDAERKQRQAAWAARQKAEQDAKAQADQLARQRGGWSSPSGFSTF